MKLKENLVAVLGSEKNVKIQNLSGRIFFMQKLNETTLVELLSAGLLVLSQL